MIASPATGQPSVRPVSLFGDEEVDTEENFIWFESPNYEDSEALKLFADAGDPIDETELGEGD